MTSWIGHFHPLAVHLPIGLLVLLGVFELLSFSSSLRPKVDPAIGVVARLAFVSVVLALVLGLLLAGEGGHPARLLKLHRALAFGVLGGSLLLVFLSSPRVPRIVYRVALAATLVALAFGADFGGKMTHGESWLAFKKPAPAPTAPIAKNEAFDVLVAPVLANKCVRCHGPDLQKGELRLDSWEAFQKEGADTILGRIRAPLADDDHMPPEDKPQLTPLERDRIELWSKYR